MDIFLVKSVKLWYHINNPTRYESLELYLEPTV